MIILLLFDKIPIYSLIILSPVETVTVLSVMNIPNDPSKLFVCLKNNTCLLITIEGKILTSYSNGLAQNGDFVAGSVSRDGKYCYCLAEDKILYCFNTETRKIERKLNVHEKDPIGIAVHPYHNIIATFAEDKKLNLWRP